MAVKKEKGVGIIIYRKEKDKILYLILQKSMGFWEFSKGHPESGENAKDTAVREMKEETGIINCSFSTRFMEKTEYAVRRDDGTHEKTVFYFLGITKQTKVLLSEEHKDYRWLEYKEAREKLSFDDLKELLDKANQFLTK